MKQKQTLCLAIDTAADTTSVALVGEDGLHACTEITTPRGQGEILLNLIQQLLDKLKKKPADLTHIAVTVGPGSFTGVRIGLATARGLGLALKIPVLGVDNFLATAYHLNKRIKIVLDSKRDDYFVQDFDAKGHAIGIPQLKTASELKKLLPFTACGTGATRLAQEIGCPILSTSQELALSAAEIVLNEPTQTVPPHPL